MPAPDAVAVAKQTGPHIRLSFDSILNRWTAILMWSIQPKRWTMIFEGPEAAVKAVADDAAKALNIPLVVA